MERGRTAYERRDWPAAATLAREAVTGLCARCHSPRGRSVQPTDADAVRFQGTTLTWSRCYQESQGGMSCITCHDPHHDAVTSPSHYQAKCLACHGASPESDKGDHGRAPVLVEGVRRVTCTVNPTAQCLGCHMPKTHSAVPHTTFTDHDIRAHPPSVQHGGAAPGGTGPETPGRSSGPAGRLMSARDHAAFGPFSLDGDSHQE
jgi:hypothetical protein